MRPTLGNRDLRDPDDLAGIKDIMRFHLEIRNRSFMKRVHRDCFLGSDAVDFMVEHGLADSRSQAVQIGRRLAEAKIIRHVGDNSRFKDASHLYYRFEDDDRESSMLAATNAGHGDLRVYGQGSQAQLLALVAGKKIRHQIGRAPKRTAFSSITINGGACAFFGSKWE